MDFSHHRNERTIHKYDTVCRVLGLEVPLSVFCHGNTQRGFRCKLGIKGQQRHAFETLRRMTRDRQITKSELQNLAYSLHCARHKDQLDDLVDIWYLDFRSQWKSNTVILEDGSEIRWEKEHTVDSLRSQCLANSDANLREQIRTLQATVAALEQRLAAKLTPRSPETAQATSAFKAFRSLPVPAKVDEGREAITPSSIRREADYQVLKSNTSSGAASARAKCGEMNESKKLFESELYENTKSISTVDPVRITVGQRAESGNVEPDVLSQHSSALSSVASGDFLLGAADCHISPPRDNEKQTAEEKTVDTDRVKTTEIHEETSPVDQSIRTIQEQSNKSDSEPTSVPISDIATRRAAEMIALEELKEVALVAQTAPPSSTELLVDVQGSPDRDTITARFDGSGYARVFMFIAFNIVFWNSYD